MLWQTESRKGPKGVADEFAEAHFGEPRKVQALKGGTDSRGYRGEFRLVGGVRTYRLVGSTSGLWTVEVVGD